MDTPAYVGGGMGRLAIASQPMTPCTAQGPIASIEGVASPALFLQPTEMGLVPTFHDALSRDVHVGWNAFLISKDEAKACVEKPLAGLTSLSPLRRRVALERHPYDWPFKAGVRRVRI